MSRSVGLGRYGWMARPRAGLLALLLLLALPTTLARADGCYFPEVAFKKLPAIPKQRALLFFRNGTERLVIESALDAEGQSFGWVIPLPARPTKFEKASPGLLKTLSIVIQPRVTHDLARQLDPWYMVAGLVAIWAVAVAILKPRSRLLAGITLPTLVLGGVLFGSLGKRRKDAAGRAGGHVEGIEVEETVTIGSYELSVLKADTAAALDEWLGANGFARLPAAGTRIVSDYVTEGWRFVAAKLRREGKGLSVPHPLAMTFPAEKPVYPMRLTALTDSPVYVEIFVVADRSALCGRLDLEFCDTYRRQALPGRYGAKGEALVGETFRRNIGHPAALREIWDGCVLTKLAGELAPKDMAEDIVFGLGPPRPYWQHLYSRRGARDAGLIAALLLWSIGLALGMLIPFSRLVAKRPRGFALLAVVFPTAVLTGAVWGGVYLSLPKTEVEVKAGKKLMYGGYELGVLTEIIAEENGFFPGRSLAEVQAAYDSYFDYQFHPNVLSGERVRREDSPGNFTVIEDQRGIVLRYYGRNGFPLDTVVSLGGIMQKHVPLLKSEDGPSGGLHRLRLVRDLRVVEPVLDAMAYWQGRRRRHGIGGGQLRVATGFDFGDDHGKWSRWWDRSRGQPRIELLRRAFDGAGGGLKLLAAHELSRLGDDRGVPVFLDGLKAGMARRAVGPMLALVRLGRDEGFRHLDGMLRPRRYHVFWMRDAVALVEALRRHPEKAAPVLLRRLKASLDTLRGGHRSRNFVRLVVNLLAVVTETRAPAVLTDKAELDGFIAAADRWCASRGIAPSPPSRP